MIIPQILFTFVMVWGVTAKIFDPCTLSKELKRLGARKEDLGLWMCIVESESSFNTSAMGSLYMDGSEYWGLFQINDRRYCKSGSKPSENVCNIACEDLLSDDIKGAFNCALKVKEEIGFEGWVSWWGCKDIIHKEKYC